MTAVNDQPWNQARLKAHQTSWVNRMRFTDETGFERSICFEPGFNSGDRQYGVSSMKVRFILRGPLGATQFLLYTGWTPGRIENRAYPESSMGADVGYHARTRQYEGQDDMGDCEYLDGARCFYDGSGLAASELFKRFAEEGEEAVWQVLRDWHDRLETDLVLPCGCVPPCEGHHEDDGS